MKLNPREAALTWATLVVALAALSWWFGAPYAQQWRDLEEAHARLAQREEVAREYLARRASWQARLDDLRGQLPRHPPEKDVTADLLKMLEQTSQRQGLSLTRREPERERAVENLAEVSINCTWEGSLDALVRFLYAVQSQGAMLDVSQLSAQPVRGATGRLKGSFTLNGAYLREGTPAESPPDGG